MGLHQSRALNASEADRFSRLVRLMGCREDAAPTIEIDEHSEPERLLEDLLDLMERVERDIPSILDILGTYRASVRHVTLYRKLIRLCAGWMGLDPKGLEDVVLTHELAHAASHLGWDVGDRIWENFDSASSADKEYFAQIFAHSLFLESGDVYVVHCMDALVNQQPPQYATYQSRKHVDVALLVRELYEARRRSRATVTANLGQLRPVRKCVWCQRLATTSVERWDTWLNKSWTEAACERCARKHEQTWIT